MVDTTTIRIHNDLKKELDKLKIYPRETYEDILKRLIKYFREGKNGSK